MELDGKRIVLTGASSGIGREMLDRLLARGCTIVAADLRPEGLPEEGRIHPFKGDLSDRHEVDRLFDFALERLGGIDVFIANAGFAYYEEIAGADWHHIEKIYRVNTFSPIYAAEKMKDLFRDRPFSVIITSSAMSFLSLPGYTLYSSTKAAVRSFASAYRFELLQGQKLQVVYPIATRTNFFSAAGGSPVPFPSQRADRVAEKIIRGIEKGSDSIFPSRLFHFLLFMNTRLPFLLSLYRQFELMKFRSWKQKNASQLTRQPEAI